MPETVFVDTGYLIALLAQDDKHHEIAVAWRKKINGEGAQLVLSSAIVLELGDAFSEPRLWAKARDVIDALERYPTVTVVEVDRALLAQARDLKSQRADKDWGLTDCTSFVIMREREITRALSCDKHFMQAGFRALLIE
jgi:predicted nucleic acid-binding protein